MLGDNEDNSDDEDSSLDSSSSLLNQIPSVGATPPPPLPSTDSTPPPTEAVRNHNLLLTQSNLPDATSSRPTVLY